VVGAVAVPEDEHVAQLVFAARDTREGRLVSEG